MTEASGDAEVYSVSLLPSASPNPCSSHHLLLSVSEPPSLRFAVPVLTRAPEWRLNDMRWIPQQELCRRLECCWGLFETRSSVRTVLRSSSSDRAARMFIDTRPFLGSTRPYIQSAESIPKHNVYLGVRINMRVGPVSSTLRVAVNWEPGGRAGRKEWRRGWHEDDKTLDAVYPSFDPWLMLRNAVPVPCNACLLSRGSMIDTQRERSWLRSHIFPSPAAHLPPVCQLVTGAQKLDFGKSPATLNCSRRHDGT